MGAKEDALKIIQGLPDDCSTDDILAELFFKKQVDTGLVDVAEGRVVTHEELKARIAKWRSSVGR
jgi:predicted transcriptional regulator